MDTWRAGAVPGGKDRVCAELKGGIKIMEYGHTAHNIRYVQFCPIFFNKTLTMLILYFLLKCMVN
ncbi:hypothetical protein FACS1894130_09410 [Spirochaetia bacterium]|nr:hypothetical protein FACS1894130_09410 [Spirochaetia bacterium]